MKLLTKDLLKKLPVLYSQEDNADPMVVCKFFTPDAGWTWYAIEGSPVDENGYYDTDKEKVDFVFFGLVAGLEVELGYFSLSELTSIRGKFQIPSDLVVKSQAADIIDLILQLIGHPNGVHRPCRNRKSRGAVLSTSEGQWATTKFDGVWKF